MSHLPQTRVRRRAAAKFRRRRFWAISVAIVFALVVTAFLNRSAIRNYFDELAGNDFSGTGKGQISLIVSDGETGESVARDLVKLGVVKNFSKVYGLIVDREQVFYPGTYQLKLQMPAEAALNLIEDPKSLVINKVTIKEGLRIGQVFSELSKATGIAKSEFEAFLNKPAALGLPESEVSVEGWLFPATYSFAPELNAKEILRQMANRMIQELDSFSVAAEDRHKVLTLASIIQKEARQSDDFYKVSRTFLNRLSISMPLQSDATVSYGSGGTTVTTTDAERADTNGYNTYVHVGLPIGPISAPGNRAIDAALHPAKGTWLYFCAVNLETGETVFSTTIAQHEVAVAQFRAWMAVNPGWNG
ncbi:MAG: hypothetical protein RL196_975 [Actinomycetota bacterium]|jgi:UPF0755 protein